MRALSPGDSGALVSLAQRRLDQLGFGPLDASGVFDATTAAAATALQGARGLPTSGEVDARTWGELLGAALGETPAELVVTPGDGDDDFPAIAPGGIGEALTEAQLRLRLMGYEIPLEERLGPATEAALRTLQEAHLLPVTGALDFDTWVVIQGATGDRVTVWDLAAPDEALEDQVGGGLSFAAGACREVEGTGGYQYRQWEDGEVLILAAPSGRGVGSTFVRGKVWEAITNEIGAFPAALDPGPGDAPAAPSVIVKRGVNGDDARKVQQQLSELGFGPLVPDGVFGKGSEAALRRFQEVIGVTADGVCDPLTWSRLNDPWPGLEPGASGEQVKALQRRLSAHGHKVEPSGLYDPETQAAVSAFQAQLGLPTTGILDVVTQGHIHGQQPRSVSGDTFAEVRAALLQTLPERVADHPEQARAKVTGALTAAIQMVGLREIPKGSNGGPEMGMITEGFSVNAPPWCALAVSYWVKQGTGATSWRELPWGFRNGRALGFGQWGESNGRFIPASQTAPVGAIYVMLRQGSGSDDGGQRGAGAARWEGNGHTGLVLEDCGQSLVTVDGNVSDMIRVCTRKKSEVIGYIIWW